MERTFTALLLASQATSDVLVADEYCLRQRVTPASRLERKTPSTTPDQTSVRSEKSEVLTKQIKVKATNNGPPLGNTSASGNGAPVGNTSAASKGTKRWVKCKCGKTFEAAAKKPKHSSKMNGGSAECGMSIAKDI